MPHVLGTVVATTGNSLGISGAARAAWRLCAFWTCSAAATKQTFIDAIDYATMMGMSVINLSLTGKTSNALQRSIQGAVAEGLVIVAATGNYNSSVLWPAAYPETVAVAATDAMDQRAPI